MTISYGALLVSAAVVTIATAFKAGQHYNECAEMLHRKHERLVEALNNMEATRLNLRAMLRDIQRAGYSVDALLNREVSLELMHQNPDASEALWVRCLRYQLAYVDYKAAVQDYRTVRTLGIIGTLTMRLAIRMHDRTHKPVDMKAAHKTASKEFMQTFLNKGARDVTETH